MHVLHQPPRLFQINATRWRLASLLAACDWLRLRSRSGLSRLLRQLRISLKAVRAHVHSPDANYVAKLRDVQQLARLPQPVSEGVLMFADEFTFFRHPSLAPAYEQMGPAQRLAELGFSKNRTWRVTAALNAWTGQVSFLDAGQISVGRLVAFYQQVRDQYPTSSSIFWVEDNWPLHFHPNVLAALQPQTIVWPLPRPASWSGPVGRVKRLNLPLRLLPLPTYASWTNPIEKLWRWLRQDLLHNHSFGDDWDGLRQAVRDWLKQFSTGSPELLRYTGLADPTRLYRSLFMT